MPLEAGGGDADGGQHPAALNAHYLTQSGLLPLLDDGGGGAGPIAAAGFLPLRRTSMGARHQPDTRCTLRHDSDLVQIILYVSCGREYDPQIKTSRGNSDTQGREARKATVCDTLNNNKSMQLHPSIPCHVACSKHTVSPPGDGCCFDALMHGNERAAMRCK